MAGQHVGDDLLVVWGEEGTFAMFQRLNPPGLTGLDVRVIPQLIETLQSVLADQK